jgi:hypothetical protein|nr:MAG TPA: hypothetical protein [Crassvirales sp.]
MSRIYGIRSDGGYPLGADQDPRAPWKEKDVFVDVTVSITYHKTIRVKLNEHYDTPDLYNAAQDEVYDDVKALSDNGWYEDEFEVVEE